GVLADRTLSEMTEDEFFQAIQPKVYGAWNLHETTRDQTLDFFIMYSSAAVVLGSPGQGNYAAANAFLDALCHARVANGLPGMSIQWGPFANVGLAAAEEVRGKRLADRGNASFSPDDGNVLFERMLAKTPVEVALMHFDIRQWLEFYPQMAGAPFFAELLRDSGKQKGAKVGRFRDELERTAPQERLAKLTKHVLHELGQVLRVDATKIDKRTPFSNLGMDSLMSLELRNRFEASLGIKLSAALLFTYASAAKLASFLLETLDKETAGNAVGEKNTANIVPPATEPESTATKDEETDDLLAMFDASAARIRQGNLR
ncbi:MAG TPA: beta-ketoacyl reductase, partial [Polyangium sp.]|nr:beta-ketoacyl reductase [Polyangium sp.]